MRHPACLEAARQLFLRKLQLSFCKGIVCGKGGPSERQKQIQQSVSEVVQSFGTSTLQAGQSPLSSNR